MTFLLKIVHDFALAVLVVKILYATKNRTYSIYIK